MDDVHFAVQGLGNPDPIVDIVAPFKALGAGNADFNGESRPYRPAHGIHDGKGQAHIILKAPAPAVLAGVQSGRHELGQQPAVAAVDGDHAKSPGLCRLCGNVKLFYGALNNLLRHLLRHSGRAPGGIGTGHRPIDGMSALIGSCGSAAPMHQFNGRNCSMPVDGLGQLAHMGLAMVPVVQSNVLGAVKREFGVYTGVTHADRSSSAHRLALIVGDGVLHRQGMHRLIMGPGR